MQLRHDEIRQKYGKDILCFLKKNQAKYENVFFFIFKKHLTSSKKKRLK